MEGQCLTTLVLVYNISVNGTEETGKRVICVHRCHRKYMIVTTPTQSGAESNWKRLIFLLSVSFYHGQRVLVVEHPVDIVDDLSGVVVWNLARPASADTLSAVHEHHGDDGNVPLRLHLLVVIKQELKQIGVHLWEQQLGKRTVGKILKLY